MGEHRSRDGAGRAGGAPTGRRGGGGGDPARGADGAPETLRIATFNVQEVTAAEVDSVDVTGRGLHPRLGAAATVIQSVRPDILLLNEVDLARAPDGTLADDDLGAVVRRFVSSHLAVGPDSIDYPFVFAAPTNTGVISGEDLDGDGVSATPAAMGSREYGEDSWGFGLYPGHFGMAVLSRHPFDEEGARTFRTFRWMDLPAHHMPVEFYGDAAPEVRLSSKSHWDVPVRVRGSRLRLLVSHPTPPAFDGPENRNGRRNFDEIGFWARYLDGVEAIYDDRGAHGGYAGEDPFAILGDLNADPSGGEAVLGGTPAISQLLNHPA